MEEIINIILELEIRQSENEANGLHRQTEKAADEKSQKSKKGGIQQKIIIHSQKV